MIIAYFPLTPFTWKLIWFEAVYSCSIKIAGLKNFAYFTGRHLCRSLLLNKFTGCEHLQPSLIFKWQIKKKKIHLLITLLPSCDLTILWTTYSKCRILHYCLSLNCFRLLSNSINYGISFSSIRPPHEWVSRLTSYHIWTNPIKWDGWLRCLN